jgi:hypothetical protein
MSGGVGGDGGEETGETNRVRLSFRTTMTRWNKIVAIAKEMGWLNAQGKPNVSRVLNHLVDRFEPKKRNGRKHG